MSESAGYGRAYGEKVSDVIASSRAKTCHAHGAIGMLSLSKAQVTRGIELETQNDARMGAQYTLILAYGLKLREHRLLWSDSWPDFRSSSRTS